MYLLFLYFFNSCPSLLPPSIFLTCPPPPPLSSNPISNKVSQLRISAAVRWSNGSKIFWAEILTAGPVLPLSVQKISHSGGIFGRFLDRELLRKDPFQSALKLCKDYDAEFCKTSPTFCWRDLTSVEGGDFKGSCHISINTSRSSNRFAGNL